MTDTIHDLAAPYVLAALDEDERARFEAHLDGCTACRTEVDELAAGMASIGSAAGGTPPASLERTVMDRVDSTPQERVVIPFGRRGARWRPAIMAAAAVVVLMIGVVGVLTFNANGVDRVLAAGDVVSITMPSTPAYEAGPVTASLSYSDSQDAAVASFQGLAGTPADLAYQLWVIDDAGPHPAGLFVPDADGVAVVLLDGVVQAGDTIGITLEPAAGSETPTGEVLFAVTV